MKTVCAWCGVLIQDGAAAPISHGICSACKAKHFPEDVHVQVVSPHYILISN